MLYLIVLQTIHSYGKAPQKSWPAERTNVGTTKACLPV